MRADYTGSRHQRIVRLPDIGRGTEIVAIVIGLVLV
jgi:hypothetical protein